MVSGVKGYDKAINRNQLLALPFEEATGLVTQDVAKPHHPIDMSVVPPTWVALANDRGMLEFNGASNYLECAAASCADLDFITGDYSIAGWINWIDTTNSEIIIGRYGVSLDGWELYLWRTPPNYLTLRHHHVSYCPSPPCPPGNPRTGCYSVGWLPGQWWFMGVTRSGAYPKMFRNGEALEVTFDPIIGMHDPDTCNRDLVIGTRFTKGSDWYQGRMWNLRVWGRELSDDDMKFIFLTERHLFGV